MDYDRTKAKVEFKKRLYKFTLQLVDLIEKLPHDNVSRRIGDQLLRSGTSIIGNYIEGQSASSKRDFTNYFNISLKSANESKLWLSILKDTKKVKEDDSTLLMGELKEISSILASSILTLKNKR